MVHLDPTYAISTVVEESQEAREPRVGQACPNYYTTNNNSFIATHTSLQNTVKFVVWTFTTGRC